MGRRERGSERQRDRGRQAARPRGRVEWLEKFRPEKFCKRNLIGDTGGGRTFTFEQAADLGDLGLKRFNPG